MQTFTFLVNDSKNLLHLTNTFVSATFEYFPQMHYIYLFLDLKIFKY